MDVPTKICRVCGGEFPYSQLVRDIRQSGGVASFCKKCRNKRDVKNRAQKADIYRKHEKERRIKNPEIHREANRRWRHKHVEEIREANRKRRKADPEKFREATRRCKERVPGRATEYARRYRKKYPDREHAAGRKFASKRRARKYAVPYTFNEIHWQRAVDYFGGVCAVCGRPQGLWHNLAPDHWIPLASPNCPGTVPYNMVPLCNGIDGCNNKKGARNPEEWLISRYGKRKAQHILKRIAEYFEWVSQQDG